MNSKWWDHNWEVLNGCSEISEGCKNCFARDYIRRFQSNQSRWQNLLTPDRKHWNGKVNLFEENKALPLYIKNNPITWFVTERGDIFHEKVPAKFIVYLFEVMDSCPLHTFLVLTKRPQRILPVLYGPEGNWYLGGGDHISSHNNIYIGITAENQSRLDERMLYLPEIYAPKFLSYEPALGKIDISKYAIGDNKISGVIAGAETGHNAKPANLDWFRRLRDDCQKFGIKFFLKQIDSKKKRMLDGQEWNELLWPINRKEIKL